MYVNFQIFEIFFSYFKNYVTDIRHLRIKLNIWTHSKKFPSINSTQSCKLHYNKLKQFFQTFEIWFFSHFISLQACTNKKKFSAHKTCAYFFVFHTFHFFYIFICFFNFYLCNLEMRNRRQKIFIRLKWICMFVSLYVFLSEGSVVGERKIYFNKEYEKYRKENILLA